MPDKPTVENTSPLVVEKKDGLTSYNPVGYSENPVSSHDLFVLQRLPLSNDEIIKLIESIPDRKKHDSSS